MIVADASVIVLAFGDDGTDGDTARSRLRDERIVAPELLDLEVASAWRRHEASGLLDTKRSMLARADLREAPIERISHRHLVERCWELRSNLTIYDAAYIALAELFDATLVTADTRLAAAPGPRCTIETI